MRSALVWNPSRPGPISRCVEQGLICQQAQDAMRQPIKLPGFNLITIMCQTFLETATQADA